MSIAVRIPGLTIVNPDALVVKKYPTDYDLSWTADRFADQVGAVLTTVSSDITGGTALIAPSGRTGTTIEQKSDGHIQFGTPAPNDLLKSDATVSTARTIFVASRQANYFSTVIRHIFSVNGFGIGIFSDGIHAVTTSSNTVENAATLPAVPSTGEKFHAVLRRSSEGSATLFARKQSNVDIMRIDLTIPTPGTELNGVFGGVLGGATGANSAAAMQLRSWPRALTDDEVDTVLSSSAARYE